ncbi:MAG: hypothetical protein EOO62_14420 [Hymenobacter sp.]|nr:MAG: hypothetical protein EOO62_14420 [Hymenobacter sp.]
MGKPFTFFFKLLLLILGTGYAARAQVTYTQVPLTAASFNADVIANGSAAIAPSLTPTTGTNLDVDGGGYYFLTQDYNTATAAHTSGIPNSGAIPNAISGYSALTYQLQPVTGSSAGNNSLRIPATGTTQTTGTGTATLATPTPATEVYLLVSSGGGASTVTITVTYSDNTSTLVAVSVRLRYARRASGVSHPLFLLV